MLRVLLVEVSTAVENINDYIYEMLVDGHERYCLDFVANEFYIAVRMFEQVIWSTEDDTRVFFEASNSYEPVETTIRRNLGLFMEDLTNNFCKLNF